MMTTAARHVPLLAGDFQEIGGRHPQFLYESIVQEAPAVGGDGANGQLGLAGSSQLAGDDDVQLRPQMPGHLGRHHHAAPGNSQDQRIFAGVCLEMPRQPCPGLHPVAEPVPHRAQSFTFVSHVSTSLADLLKVEA